MKSIVKLLPSFFFLTFIIGLIVLVDIKGTQYLVGMIPKVPHADKIGHFALFGLLALLLNYGFGFRDMVLLGKKVMLGSIVIFAFAAAEEFSQIFLTTRSFDLIDLAADILGIWLFSQSKIRRTICHFYFRFRMILQNKG